YQEDGFVRAVNNQVYQLYGIYKEKGEELTSSQENPELLKDVKPLQLEDLVQPVAANKNLQALALDQVRFNNSLPLQSLIAYSEQGESIDLTDKVVEDGMLDWEAPDGNWTLYGIFQGGHGKMVERAAPGGEGNVIDHFSAEAIRHYLTKFDSAFQGRDITALRSFFNDSYGVDDARGQANWTPNFLQAFQEKHGYNLQEYWPALFGKDTEENNQRVLSDYRETFSDLLLETFTQEWDQWAEGKSAMTRNQAHGSPANILDLYAATDIPETEGTDILRIKFATSAAHVTGKKLASSEAATWLDEHFFSNLSTLKENVDRYFVGGVNHVFYHGSCYSPTEDTWPGRLFYAAIHANPRNSLWHDFPAFNQYITHTQTFLQAGKPDNDILLYFPAYDRFATPQRELLDHFDGHGPSLEGTAVEMLGEQLQEEGYSFDFISDLQIEVVKVNNGELITGGTNYKTLVLPAVKYLPLNTFKEILAQAESGATVIIHKALPESVPGLGNLNERQAEFQELVESLAFREMNKMIKQATVGSGSVILGEDIDELLDYAGVEPEEMANQGLQYARRKYENG
ncbi:MAG: glycoside hydrolase family 2 protein, partial [Bacteroidetes bacterium]|nr:glycoside hydrolase family 2 protein [Bacteroidota bacterium]